MGEFGNYLGRKALAEDLDLEFGADLADANLHVRQGEALADIMAVSSPTGSIQPIWLKDDRECRRVNRIRTRSQYNLAGYPESGDKAPIRG